MPKNRVSSAARVLPRSHIGPLPPLLAWATRRLVGCLIIRSGIPLMSGPCSIGTPGPSEAE